MSARTLVRVGKKGGWLVRIRVVKVGARQSIVAAVTDDAAELYVAEPAREGAANKEVERIMAAALGVAKSNVAVVQGLKARDKIVLVNADAFASGEEVERKLADAVSSS